VCQCIGVLESDSAPLSLVYACFLYVFVMLREQSVLSDKVRVDLERSLQYRWGRIYSHVHALAFVCDPYFFSMRSTILSRYGPDFLGLGKGDVLGQCRDALDHLARGDEERAARLSEDFLLFSFNDNRDMSGLKDFAPQLIWSQSVGTYPVLASIMVDLYVAPTSTAGVERNHKYGKMVQTCRRGRLGDGKMEKQVCVAYNGVSLEKNPPVKRGAPFAQRVADLLFDDPTCEVCYNQDDAVEDDEEEATLLRSLDRFENAADIEDTLLFTQAEPTLG